MIRCAIAAILLCGVTAGCQRDAMQAAHPAVIPAAVIPDPTLTPGVVRTTDVDDICSHGTSQLRHWSQERDERIMGEYQLSPTARYDYEIDHLIPLGVGGADDDANLWPEPRATIEPVWTAERKDALEHKLHDMVCSYKLDIQVAQAAFADDWTAAWALYVKR
jgi:hypothetical protein